MKFVLIPDKFKGSLSAAGVISALTRGIKRVYPKAEVDAVIASDGGDGFLEAISHAIPVEEVVCDSVDPLQRRIRSRYLLDRKKSTAYIELAECSGMVLLNPDERDPVKTTTLGTGLQIRHAIEQGAGKIYIGLGGSATNDGGTGIAHGLGFRFLDSSGDALDPIGGNLVKIKQISDEDVPEGIGKLDFYAVNDVNNPLLGVLGAARVYAAQKGAGEKEIGILEQGLRQLDEIAGHTYGSSAVEVPGAGAAGGAAFGLRTFLKAEFIKGIDFMLHLTGTDALFGDQQIDLLVTGEGAIDEQTLQGKLIHGVVDLGKRYRVPVIAVCGKLDLNEDLIQVYGLKAILEIRDRSKPVSYSMENAARLVEEKIYNYLSAKGK